MIYFSFTYRISLKALFTLIFLFILVVVNYNLGYPDVILCYFWYEFIIFCYYILSYSFSILIQIFSGNFE